MHVTIYVCILYWGKQVRLKGIHNTSDRKNLFWENLNENILARLHINTSIIYFLYCDMSLLVYQLFYPPLPNIGTHYMVSEIFTGCWYNNFIKRGIYLYVLL